MTAPQGRRWLWYTDANGAYAFDDLPSLKTGQYLEGGGPTGF